MPPPIRGLHNLTQVPLGQAIRPFRKRRQHQAPCLNLRCELEEIYDLIHPRPRHGAASRRRVSERTRHRRSGRGSRRVRRGCGPPDRKLSLEVHRIVSPGVTTPVPSGFQRLLRIIADSPAATHDARKPADYRSFWPSAGGKPHPPKLRFGTHRAKLPLRVTSLSTFTSSPSPHRSAPVASHSSARSITASAADHRHTHDEPDCCECTPASATSVSTTR